MWSRILARTNRVSSGWSGQAFGSEGTIAIGAGPTFEDCASSLRAGVSDYLGVDGAHYLRSMGFAGGPEALNCPEGAIRLPVDLWYCKVAKRACPIQAQVAIHKPQQFLDGCLLQEDRKLSILRIVSDGSYLGFHHVRGRYLCPRCENERKGESGYSYHYPWELAHLEDYSGINAEEEMATILPKLLQARLPRSSVQSALCARHCIELARALSPLLVENLHVLEFEIQRP